SFTVTGGSATVAYQLTASSFSGTLFGNATTATSLQLGAANQLPYQSGLGVTAYAAAPGANVVLWGNSGAPSWTNTPTFTATNVTGYLSSNLVGGIPVGLVNLSTAGETNTFTSSKTITANAFSVGGSSFTVSGGSAT